MPFLLSGKFSEEKVCSKLKKAKLEFRAWPFSIAES